ncbi:MULTISPECIES: DUF952 domain-containing protein [Streptomyces]|uniref:DUF952 domain-containing protein n=1 Tax=Streptomyces lichenis TaxID=2306967 RepID=A0ABT0IIT0_9ACTN|nr:DUF952 domain-containing protein [Streptomyces lichenis]MCK8681211.1 DUF952 domain-containing protein [Streptomyces lichenis]
MIFHLVPEAEWPPAPGSAYRPASLSTEGFVHCSGDEAIAQEVAAALYREVPGTLLLLTLDESRLTAELRWEEADGRSFPHVYGEIAPDAVVAVQELRRDAEGQPLGLAPRR